MRRRSLFLAAPALILPRQSNGQFIPHILTPPQISSPTSTWSPTNKNSNNALSNSNLTVTGGGNVIAAGLGTSTITSGQLIYFEITINHIESSNSDIVGIGNSSVPFADGSYLGIDTSGFGLIADGRVIYNNTILATITGFTDSDVVCIAVRFNDGTIFRRINNGQWNDSGSADPSTNTGGAPIGVTGNLFAAYSTSSNSGNNAQYSLRTTAAYTIPSGFSYLS